MYSRVVTCVGEDTLQLYSRVVTWIREDTTVVLTCGDVDQGGHSTGVLTCGGVDKREHSTVVYSRVVTWIRDGTVVVSGRCVLSGGQGEAHTAVPAATHRISPTSKSLPSLHRLWCSLLPVHTYSMRQSRRSAKRVLGRTDWQSKASTAD